MISDIVKNIGTKKVFTKLDLYWGYNNVWVKKRDKCKGSAHDPRRVVQTYSNVFWTY